MATRRISVAVAALLMSNVLVGVVAAADPDLVGWWKFDDGTGTVAVDSSGNGHDGTFEGDPEWVAGMFGGGLDFDGLGGERVTLGTLDVDAPALSIALWLKADNLDTPGNDPRMISKADGGANDDHWWMISSGRTGGNKFLRFRLKTAPSQQTAELKAGPLVVDEWVHCVAWWDGTVIRIYKNGVEAGEMAKTGDALATDPSVYAAIGNQPIGAENRPFDGILDDVRIYSRALTEEEITAIMEGAGAKSPLAVGPSPRDGEMIGTTWARLEWTPGAWAVTHDLYMSTSFDDVQAGAEGAFISSTAVDFQVVGAMNLPFPEGLLPGTTYYWRVDEINDANDNSPWEGTVWSFSVSPRTAHRPIPADSMKFVDAKAQLTWTPGWGSIIYTVYFGTDPDEVAGATGGFPQAETVYDPGSMEPGTTYYWRVDVFDGVEWLTGDVWAFTTAGTGGGLRGEYANYAGGVPTPPESGVQNVVLTRIDPGINFQWGNGSPELDVVNEDNFAVRWTGELEAPLTGRYTFSATTDDGVLLWVDGKEMARAWRTQTALEQAGQIDLVAGQVVPIEMLYFATTGNAMAELRWQHEFIPKEIVPAAALSPPVRASHPAPANLAMAVPQSPVLQWTAGEQAAQHDVYFGDDPDAVAAADTSTAGIYRGRQDGASFLPGALEWGKTYYWRVDEVNDVHPDSPWAGSLWSFTTADFIVIDDFESYSNEVGSRPFEVWVDGIGFTQPEPGNPGNGSNAAVGHDIWSPGSPHFNGLLMETGIVNTGSQSMPVYYDNTVAPYYSEIERTWAIPQDWTISGVDTLTLSVRGLAANGPDRLYVTLTDSAGRSATLTLGDNDTVTSIVWTELSVPLSDFAGVDPAAITKMIVGVGNPPAAGGAGTLFLDDFRVTDAAE